MAQSHGGERMFSFHNLLKMLMSSNSSTKPTNDEADLAEDVDEPPEHVMHATRMNSDQIVLARPAVDRKESLLTRALRSSPEMSLTDPHAPHYDSYMYRSYPHSNISGVSTAELTSDGGLTSPSLSNTPSPPLPPQMMRNAALMGKKNSTPKLKVADASETSVEANLGRKRCISFACGRKSDDKNERDSPISPAASQELPLKAQAPQELPTEEPVIQLKRKTTLTFACPGRETVNERERSPPRKPSVRPRCRGSPAPVARRASPSLDETPKQVSKEAVSASADHKGVPTSGLGKFEESEATRFHEFASSMDEDDEWVNRDADYTQKITLNDCMKKEMAIRRLGEQAEEEALEEEDDMDDLPDDDSTVHDFSSDDGNESDNEAGFAESDESDEDGDDIEFWGSSHHVPEPTSQPIDTRPSTMERRASNTSFDSMTDDHLNWLPAPVQRTGARRASKTPKSINIRPRSPNLPDSTDFVCGTLDEDRPLELAYKNCLEERRRLKQIVIPQDIDPSFPTSDPEDDEDLEPSEKEVSSVPSATGRRDEFTRGRPEGEARKQSPLRSPRRLMSPPPRRTGRTSPKRLKSPPPRIRAKSPTPSRWQFTEEMHIVESPEGLNISHLVQRRPLVRTKSVPRVPNPFFAGLDKDHRWQGIPPFSESPEDERSHSRTRELHTRGPVDIVEGLEKKRQKRKEKFWRQHCRKAAKEQMGKRPVPGHGAERMKELGLEVAERCRAYGVGQDAQLVLSV